MESQQSLTIRVIKIISELGPVTQISREYWQSSGKMAALNQHTIMPFSTESEKCRLVKQGLLSTYANHSANPTAVFASKMSECYIIS